MVPNPTIYTARFTARDVTLGLLVAALLLSVAWLVGAALYNSGVSLAVGRAG